MFRVFSESDSEGRADKVQQGIWRSSVADDFASIKFEFKISKGGSQSFGSTSEIDYATRRHNSNEIKESLSFSICKRLVQVRNPCLLKWIIAI